MHLLGGWKNARKIGRDRCGAGDVREKRARLVCGGKHLAAKP
jgi:hypothetical protein